MDHSDPGYIYISHIFPPPLLPSSLLSIFAYSPTCIQFIFAQDPVKGKPELGSLLCISPQAEWESLPHLKARSPSLPLTHRASCSKTPSTHLLADPLLSSGEWVSSSLTCRPLLKCHFIRKAVLSAHIKQTHPNSLTPTSLSSLYCVISLHRIFTITHTYSVHPPN